MSEYIDHRDASNLEELLDAVDALRDNSDDRHASTVYLKRPVRLTLEEETLTDGSTVKNIRVTFVD